MRSSSPAPIALMTVVALAVVLISCTSGSGTTLTPTSTSTSTSTTATTTSASTTSASTTSASTTSTTIDSPTAPTNVPDGPLGIGDALFPDLGNAGLDVTHYDVDVAYDHDTKVITGDVKLSITATTDLPLFSLDAVGLDVSDVSVDGHAVGFERRDPELIIAPSSTIAGGTPFTVRVVYTAMAATPLDGSPDEASGWFDSDLGSLVVNEPDGARTWLPSNDHPSDKATYHFTIRTAAGMTGVANGSLVSHTPGSDGEVWVWDQPEQMATYLIQVLTGPFDIVEGQGPNGLPLTSAILTQDRVAMQPYLDVTPTQIDFFDDYFGPYPLAGYGIAMSDGNVGGAIEDQGRSLFSRAQFAGVDLGQQQQALLSHELAHQWFGDAVSPARWQDIWLNESFATYAEWMWLEHSGFATVKESAQRGLDLRQLGYPPTASPAPDSLFGFQEYDGGAVVLEALRRTVGDDAFFSTLRHWSQDNVETSKTTADFIALASAVSGRDLTNFFDIWLYSADLPDAFPS